jgi:hypothetical protein
VAPGTYTVTESAPPAGWQFTSLSCSAGGAVSSQTATITLAAGASVTCTYTNTKLGSITINKVTEGGNATFAYTHNVGTAAMDPDVASPFNITTVANAGSQAFTNVAPGTYTVTESAPPAGWAFKNLSCSAGGAVSSQTATITLAAGANVTCTYTNTELGTIVIEKEIPGSIQTFTFTRRISPSTTDAGDNPNPTLGNGQSSTSNKKLLPGTYRVCETNLAVSFGNPTFTVNGTPTVPTADGLGNFCVTFALAAGQTITVHVVNTPPPGGGTRTIGYWKNWSSCAQSNGGQYDKAVANGDLNKTLDGNLAAAVSAINPLGDITALTCEQAVALLSKNAIDGTKRAGDPIYNMVAQMLGARLNVAAGAGTCAALNTALTAAQNFLNTLNFLGTGSYKGTLSPADEALVQGWAGTFGSYNEGTLGGGCPTHV